MRTAGLIVIVSLVLTGCSNDGASDSTDVRDTTPDPIEADLSAAQQRVADLELLITALQDDLDEERSGAETTARLADQELRDAEEALQEAERLQGQLEQLVAQLTATYSDEIQAGRVRLTEALITFSCAVGKERAIAGTLMGNLTSTAISALFTNAAEFEALLSDPDVASAVSVFETLGEAPYTTTGDEVLNTAVSCWQEEDQAINAALYFHEGVLRTAALNAACTLGASEVFGDFSQGFEDTATYASWELNMGYEEANEHLDSIEDRFGTFEAFLAIPEEVLLEESERCADLRPMISPKTPGTWNVGEEILVGNWRAYDVSDCYWARLAENGDIRDNHFGDALRISVNVQSSDAQFEISGCSFYYANP